MIQINLLPIEYRKAEATPIARFAAILAGAILVTSGVVGYGYVHYSKLKGVRDLRVATEETYATKAKRADASKALQGEIAAYESRRKAIQAVARNRILHSRKLDEFLDIIDNRGDKSAYYVWLENLDVTPPRHLGRGRKRKMTNGGAMSFSGWAESRDGTRVTNLRDAIRKDPFFSDFSGISLPVFKAVDFDDSLEPRYAGRFNYTMTLRPLGQASPKKG